MKSPSPGQRVELVEHKDHAAPAIVDDYMDRGLKGEVIGPVSDADDDLYLVQLEDIEHDGMTVNLAAIPVQVHRLQLKVA